MSKISLKKELVQMDETQLRQIILDAYSARKEFREYLEFFINPDVKALEDKYLKILDKEIGRTKYSRSNARISRIKKFIEEFKSFGVEPEDVIKLQVYTLSKLTYINNFRDFTPTLIKGTASLIEKTLDYGDKTGNFSYALESVESIIEERNGSRLLRRTIDETLKNYLENQNCKRH